MTNAQVRNVLHIHWRLLYFVDSESDCQLSEHDETLSLPSSSSSFYLDLNVAENSVHISRPVAVKQDQHQTDSEPGEVKSPARK